MKFIYFYSPLYEFYNEHIQQRLSKYFELIGLTIDDVSIKNSNGHHFSGHTIKIELLIDQIKQNTGSFIIFSDATIFINSKNSSKLKEYLSNYDSDIVFINEFQNNCYNIGMMLIKCGQDTLNFFSEVLENLQNNSFNHDQACVNSLIKSNKLKHCSFGEEIYCCSYFLEERRNEFIIYKSFIQNTGNLISNYNQRIENFYKLELINSYEYNKWIR